MKKNRTPLNVANLTEQESLRQGKEKSMEFKIPFVPQEVDFDLDIWQHKQLCQEQNAHLSKAAFAAAKEQNALNLYHGRWNSFQTVMMFLLEYIQHVGRTTRKSIATNFAGSYRTLQSMIEDSQERKKKRYRDAFTLKFRGKNEEEVFSASFPLVDRDKIDTYMDYMRAAIAAPRILAETSIQQIVNAWEYFMGKLLGLKYRLNPTLIDSKYSVTMADILMAKDFDGIKEFFENMIIKEFIKMTTDDKLNALKKELDINFIDVFDSIALKELKEIIIRRHAIVHCDSIAQDDYCKAIKKLGLTVPARGELLLTDVPYAVHAWDVMYAAGVVIAYMACLKNAHNLKSKDLERFANGRLVSSSFDALKHGRNHAACLILEYANTIRIETEWAMLAIKINLAIAYKRQAKVKEMRAVLDGYNWEYAPKEFLAAVLTLKGENKKALKVLLAWCGKKMDRIKNVHDWIVFDELRNEPEFKKRMSSIYVKKNKCLVKVSAPSVNDNGDEETRKEQLSALFETAIKFSQSISKLSS
jgi:hypothetical protein